MLRRFIGIREELLTVADRDGSSLTFDGCAQFLERSNKYAYVMSEIDLVTSELKRHGSSLSNGR